MRLVWVEISGFRGYAEPVRVEIERNLTLLLGRNDAGKSSILDALELYFSGGKPDRFDFTVGGSGPVRIDCAFDELPPTLVLDESARTTWAAQRLLSEDRLLVVRREWKSHAAAPVTSVLASHPVPADGTEAPSYLTMKVTELRALCKEAGIADGVNQSVSSDMREKLWELRLENGMLELSDVQVPLTGPDGKSVERAIFSEMPLFHVFRADRPNDETEAIAQDPAKLVIREVIDRNADALERVSDEIVAQLSESLNDVVEKLADIDATLATSLGPGPIVPRWEKAFADVGFVDDQQVPLYRRGSGARRLVLLSFFRARLDRRQQDGGRRSLVIAVEEPETALHPDLQVQVLDALLEVGSEADCQVVATSHSTNLVPRVPIDVVRFITSGPYGREIHSAKSTESTKVDELLKLLRGSMGIHTDHSVKCFLLVEGQNDITGLCRLTRALEHISPLEFASLEVLESRGLLRVLPIGGCGSLELWRTPLAVLARPVFLLLDSDRKFRGAPAKSAVEGLPGDIPEGAKVVVLDRRELENYLTPEAICEQYASVSGFEEVFRAKASGSDWEYLDIPGLTAQALKEVGYRGGQGVKEAKAKKDLALAFENEGVARGVADSPGDLGAVLREVMATVGLAGGACSAPR